MLRSIEKLTRQVLQPEVLPGYEHDPSLNHRSSQAESAVATKKAPSRNRQLSKEKAKLRAQALGKK